MKKFIVLLCLSSVVAGCSGMADVASKAAGMGVISKKNNFYDSSTTISVSPQCLYGSGALGASVKLGAAWTSSSPEYVTLHFSHNSSLYNNSRETYISIDGFSVLVDGNQYSFQMERPTKLKSSGYNSVTKDIYTESSNGVVVPLVLIRNMVNAENCGMRVYTSDGVQDIKFSVDRIPGGQPTARISLRELLMEIDSYTR